MDKEKKSWNSGDRVRITKNPELPKRYPYWVPEMDKYKGKVITLESRDTDHRDCWSIEENTWIFSKRWFESVIKKANLELVSLL